LSVLRLLRRTFGGSTDVFLCVSSPLYTHAARDAAFAGVMI